MDATSNRAFSDLIVGVDFSPFSKIVVKQALRLQEDFKAPVTVVYASSPVWQFETMNPYLHYPTQIEVKDLENSLRQFYKLEASDKIRLVIKAGIPADVIITEAQEMKNPLLVIGSQGTGAVSSFILGSQAERIALESPFPVWVHRGRKIVGMNKVLVPIDFSERSEALIEKMEVWANSFRCVFVQPTLVPILDFAKYKETALKLKQSFRDAVELFREKRPNIPLTVVTGEPPEKIASLAQKFDLIALVPREGNKTFGRVTNKVIRLAKTPVLVVHSPVPSTSRTNFEQPTKSTSSARPQL